MLGTIVDSAFTFMVTVLLNWYLGEVTTTLSLRGAVMCEFWDVILVTNIMFQMIFM